MCLFVCIAQPLKSRNTEKTFEYQNQFADKMNILIQPCKSKYQSHHFNLVTVILKIFNSCSSGYHLPGGPILPGHIYLEIKMGGGGGRRGPRYLMTKM